jgi:hypothetical protein
LQLDQMVAAKGRVMCVMGSSGCNWVEWEWRWIEWEWRRIE